MRSIPKSDVAGYQEKQIVRELVSKMNPDWLIKVFEYYCDRFKSDNDKIWQIGSVFAPLSLSTFPIYLTLGQPNLSYVLLLGFSSSMLAGIWLIHAENHRAFQNKSYLWIEAILERVGAENKQIRVKIPDDEFSIALSKRRYVQQSIRLFSISVIIVWLFIILISFYTTYKDPIDAYFRIFFH